MKHPVWGLALSFLCSTCTDVYAQDFSVVKMGHVLRFDGTVTLDAAKAINEMLDQDSVVLLVNSPGGDAGAGLSIAEELRKRDVMVVVDKYCMSACANYIFIGARRKSLNPGAILGFHGGLAGSPMPHFTSEDYPLMSEPQLANVEERIKRIYDEETGFYARIGFDASLLKTSGYLTAAAVPNKSILIAADGKTVRYDFAYLDRARAWTRQLEMEGKNYTFNISVNKQSDGKFYFPSRGALERHGVTGIDRYAAPETADGLRRLAEHLDKPAGLPDLVLVGDPAS